MEWYIAMKIYKYLMKLNLRYISKHKKLYIHFIIGIFLSTFLLSSIYIVKNSYDNFNLKSTSYLTGEWEVRYYHHNIPDMKEELKQLIDEGLINLTYTTNEGYHYNTTSNVVTFVSEFNNLINVNLIEGKYPTTNSEIIINEKLALKDALKIGDKITMSNFEHVSKDFEIVGFSSSPIDLGLYSYLEDDSNIEMVYAQIQDKRYLELLGDAQVFMFNDTYLNTKYYGNTSFDYTINLFVLFVFGCMLIQMYNSTKIYLKKKANYMQSLYYVGATNKQRFLMTFLEFFFINILIMLISFIVSIGIWNLLINGLSIFIKNLLDSQIDFNYVFNLKYQVFVIIMVLLICLLSMLVALRFSLRNKYKKLRLRNIKFKKISISSRLGLLDIIRKRYGIIICLSIYVSSILFMCSQIIIESWLHNYEVTLDTEENINASYALYNVTRESLDTFYKELDRVSELSKNSSYEVIITISGMGYINEDYNELSLIYRENENSDNELLALVTEKDNIPYEKLTFELTNQWSIPIDTLSLEYSILKKEEVKFAYSGAYLLISKELLYSWLDYYDNIAISGNIILKSDNLMKSEELMNALITLEGDNYIYIHNNVQIMNHFTSVKNSIRILVYTLNSIIIFVCLFMIYGMLSQYLQNRKEEIQLLTYIGMHTKQLKKQFIVQSIIYAFLSILLLIPSYLMIINIINKYFSLNHSMLIVQIIIISVVIVILLITLMLINLNKELKR